MLENQTYPLSFLFVLLTVSAVGLAIFGCVVPVLAEDGGNAVRLLSMFSLGGAAGGVVGVFMGCYHIDRWSGVFICGLLGAVIGAPTTCLFFADTNSFPRLLTSQMVGAAWILFLAALLRFGIRKETE